MIVFVKKDYNFDFDRDNRSNRLFQIESDGVKREKSRGYVMYEGQVFLDGFDHGLRNTGPSYPCILILLPHMRFTMVELSTIYVFFWKHKAPS